MKLPQRILTVGGALALTVAAAGTAAAVTAPADTLAAAPTALAAHASAMQATASLVASRPSYLKASADDTFVQHEAVASHGTQYVAYDRTYKGLKVTGGDFVLATDGFGQLKFASVAQDHAIGNLSVTPQVAQAAAEATAKAKIVAPTLEGTQLVVFALGGTPTLAWESTVHGHTAQGGATRQTVDVDAVTGKVLASKEHVTNGTGNSAYNGPVTIATSGSGSSFSMTDPTQTNLSCQDAANNTTFTKSSDSWGNGSAANKETGCVDALFATQTEVKMLSQWLGRNGLDGSGGAWPIRVGLADVNAYYDGTQVQIGHNNANQWISSIDVVAHENGHGIDDHTPGGISGNGTQEWIADSFGAATEYFANEPAPYDTPDWTVGESINLVGTGPIRNMYNPSLVNGNPNCYSSSIPSGEVHAVAGPGNHWDYLVAMGSNPAGGPVSPTCNSTTITGIGVQKWITVLYNAMLMKTSSASYLKYRTWTLQAAKNLYGATGCTEFNTVKAAWDAVSVPAQAGDPTCTGGGTPTPTPTKTTSPSPSASPTASPTSTPGTCSGQKLGNPGFETGTATPWTATSGVLDSGTTQPAHGGSWKAWMNGYGSSHTDTLSQSVAIPAGCHATLSFYLHIDTAETGSTVYDKLTVTAGSTTLATYSNVNAAAGYVLRTFDVSSLAGTTATIKFNGVEDSSLQTSFVIDDTALTLS
ncbi:zinc metalloprotease [Longispora fulva]|uniref:Zn-dependent metalloprotease n=1 Tax=Longispora fulva TaxID=619741 RepID=A0A8J7KIZ6_9ACTN|nr:M4 family metallopeptidase [Longispora fulva]MBG6136384.1 Zn-dependent metalloprotease [Longispora fulva]GIG63443.1 zinc metalloprotease [Longispora fulva]